MAELRMNRRGFIGRTIGVLLGGLITRCTAQPAFADGVGSQKGVAESASASDGSGVAPAPSDDLHALFAKTLTPLLVASYEIDRAKLTAIKDIVGDQRVTGIPLVFRV